MSQIATLLEHSLMMERKFYGFLFNTYCQIEIVQLDSVPIYFYTLLFHF